MGIAIANRKNRCDFGALSCYAIVTWQEDNLQKRIFMYVVFLWTAVLGKYRMFRGHWLLTLQSTLLGALYHASLTVMKSIAHLDPLSSAGLGT